MCQRIIFRNEFAKRGDFASAFIEKPIFQYFYLMHFVAVLDK